MYALYTPVSHPFALGSSGARDGFSTISYSWVLSGGVFSANTLNSLVLGKTISGCPLAQLFPCQRQPKGNCAADEHFAQTEVNKTIRGKYTQTQDERECERGNNGRNGRSKDEIFPVYFVLI